LASLNLEIISSLLLVGYLRLHISRTNDIRVYIHIYTVADALKAMARL